jgi:hypothetical protein
MAKHRLSTPATVKTTSQTKKPAAEPTKRTPIVMVPSKRGEIAKETQYSSRKDWFTPDWDLKVGQDNALDRIDERNTTEKTSTFDPNFKYRVPIDGRMVPKGAGKGLSQAAKTVEELNKRGNPC